MPQSRGTHVPTRPNSKHREENMLLKMANLGTNCKKAKAEYLKKLAEVKLQQHNTPAAINAIVNSLLTKHQGRPLLLGKVLDTPVQDYIKAQREACAPHQHKYCNGCHRRYNSCLRSRLTHTSWWAHWDH